MTDFPRWYDWWLPLVLVCTTIGNFIWGGLAAVVAYWLLLFAAYRLGKAIGR